MNGLCFSQNVSDKVEGSFLSYYDEDAQRFRYFVTKLDSFPIDFLDDPMQGKIWVPYINNKRQDWDELVQNNFRMSIYDKVWWKLEPPFP